MGRSARNGQDRVDGARSPAAESVAMTAGRSTPERTPGADRVVSLVVAFGFSVGLGVATVAIPLLALEAGYDEAAVGFLVATSAAAQLGTRLILPWLLGWFPDRTLIAVASALMSSASLLLGEHGPARLRRGPAVPGRCPSRLRTAARHMPSGVGGRPVRRLVDLDTAGNVGTLIGPALAGSLAALGLPFALAAAAIGALGAAAGTPSSFRLNPYDRRRSAGTMGLLRREGFDIACWASVVGGGWWSMIG